MANTRGLLGTNRAFEVPAHIGQVRLIVTDNPAKAKTAVGAFMHRSPARQGLRIAGGCAGMTPADKLDMLAYFRAALAGYSGFVSSGATRNEANGAIDPMVTDVPAMLAKQLGNCVLTISTVPRTGDMALTGDSRLVLDAAHGINPQPGVHMIVVFQHQFADQALEWDGDLDGYFALFNTYVREGGWRFGLPVWNGGGVTQTEAIRAANLGWPVFLIEGSGRKADELAAAVRAKRLTGPFSIVRRDDPATLRTALQRRGFNA